MMPFINPKAEWFSELFFLYGLKDKGKLPDDFKKTMGLWEKYVPQLHAKLIHKSLGEIEEIVFTLGDEYKILFDKLSVNNHYEWILKCDVSRYILCYHHGSSYCDLDLFPKHNITRLLNRFKTKNIIFVVETVLEFEFAVNMGKTPIRNNRAEYPYRIANFLMFCRSSFHPIWLDVLKTISSRAELCSENMTDYDVLYISGPDALTESVFSNIGKYDDIGFISNKDFLSHFTTLNHGSWRNN